MNKQELREWVRDMFIATLFTMVLYALLHIPQ